jgi:hypothetical protein
MLFADPIGGLAMQKWTRMRATSCMAVALFCCCVAVPASNQEVPDKRRAFLDGNTLYDAMRSTSNQDRRFVYGYIAGITDSESTTSGAPGRAFCLPRYAKLGQLFDITKKWFGDHPEQLHLPAYLVVQWALTDVYACPIAKR